MSTTYLEGQATGASNAPAIGPDGRLIAFQSTAADLVPDDTNGVQDVFLKDRWNHIIWRVSLTADGQEANGPSAHPALALDSWVAYESEASNLVAGDTNEVSDIFLTGGLGGPRLASKAPPALDGVLGLTMRISVSDEEAEANGASHNPSISADGFSVAFESVATNLVADDTNGASDVFVRNWYDGTTIRASVASDGSQANGPSYLPMISEDGRYVAFVSEATNLAPGGTNGLPQVYVRDLKLGKTELVSVAGDGTQANSAVLGRPSISLGGRFVAFASAATNLVTDDTNGVADVFERDRQTGQTVRVSVANDGSQANGASSAPCVGTDGRFVAFASEASNLVDDDLNGVQDVFVRDTLLMTTLRVSVPNNGASPPYDAPARARVFVPVEANGPSGEPALHMSDFDEWCCDNWVIAFSSDATNLVDVADTNDASDVFVREYYNSEDDGQTDLAHYCLDFVGYGEPVVDAPALQPPFEYTPTIHGQITINGVPFRFDAVDDLGYVHIVNVPYGTDLEVEAIPEPGYLLACWNFCECRGGCESDSYGWDTNPASPGGPCGSIVFSFMPALTITGTGGTVAVDGDEKTLPYVGPFPWGIEATLEAIPDAEHIFVGWAGALSGTENPVTISSTGPTFITALFAYPEVTLHVTKTGEGSVKLNGATLTLPYTYTYPGGATLAMEAVPAPGWQFTGWGGDVSSMKNPISLLLLEDMNIGATFAPLDPTPHTLTITGSNGTVAVDGVSHALPYSGTVYAGEMVTLQATANAGHVFTGWTGDLTGNTNPATIPIPGHNVNITAHFPTPNVAVNLTGIGKGSVKVNGTLHGLPWSGIFAAGGTVNLEAVPDTGWVFSEWSGDLTGNDNPASVVLLEPVSVTAAFTATPVTLQVNHSGLGDGMVKVNSALHALPWSGVFSYGATVTVEAAPGDCDWFREWSGALTGYASPTTLVMNGNRTLTADFAPISIFTDVGCPDWAALAIAYCADAGVVLGYPDGSFLPHDQVTRDQMAVFIARAVAGDDAFVPTPSATAAYPDVPTSFWAYKYIQYCDAQNIVTGYPDGLYHPELVVDRAQMAVYVARSIADPVGEAGLASYTPPTTPSFSDVPVSHWAYKWIEYLDEQGVVTGYPDGTYHPANPITRDQMAVFISRAFNLR